MFDSPRKVKSASREGTILGIGDMNIDLQKLGETSYYLKKLAEEHLSMIGECGLELIEFGYTWSRTWKDGIITRSAIDQAFTNKPTAIKNYFKIPVSYSDHSLICVDLNLSIKISNSNNQTTKSRDMRKLRSNPKFFLKGLSNIDWSNLVNFKDVDDMDEFSLDNRLALE